jgi:RND family efflux transporter MFP subunit
MKKISLLIMVCLVAATSLIAGCGGEKSSKMIPTPVRVQVVEERSGVEGFRYSASIMPYTQINLAFKVGGYIQEILQIKGADGKMRNVQEGDAVPNGTVLAKVREADYIAKLNQAKSQLANAQAAFTKANADFRRASNLFKTESITEKDFDTAKARHDETQAQVAGASARVDEAQIAFNDASLKAPMKLLVLKRNIEVGAFVGPGSTGFVVADTSSVKAKFGVPDMILETMRMGSYQTVTTDVFAGREFKGIITSVSPSADPHSRIFDVEITVPNRDGRLMAGMIVSLEIAGTKLKKPMAVVPLNAIVRPRDNPAGYALYIIEEKEGKHLARQRTIKVGEVFGNMIAVTEGIKKGDRVIVTGATLVVDGDEVKIAL